jgi:hypothetical protein
MGARGTASGWPRAAHEAYEPSFHGQLVERKGKASGLWRREFSGMIADLSIAPGQSLLLRD